MCMVRLVQPMYDAEVNVGGYADVPPSIFSLLLNSLHYSVHSTLYKV